MEDVFVCVWAQKGRQSLPMFTLTPALHYRDRYEGQLNEFLLENKNLKEQLTTLQVVWLAIKSWTSNFTLKSQSQFEIKSHKFSGGGGPACGGKGRGSWSPLLSFSYFLLSLLWLLLLLLKVRGAQGLREELNSQLASTQAKAASLEAEVSR